ARLIVPQVAARHHSCPAPLLPRAVSAFLHRPPPPPPYPLSLHDALPISYPLCRPCRPPHSQRRRYAHISCSLPLRRLPGAPRSRSEEHTSELQSRFDIVCRLLLETNNMTILQWLAQSKPTLRHRTTPRLS